MDALGKWVISAVVLLGLWLSGLDRLIKGLFDLLASDPTGWIVIFLIGVLVIPLLHQAFFPSKR